MMAGQSGAISAILAEIVAAYRARDADRAMAPYVADPELFVFDIAPPLHTLGFAESLIRTREFMAATEGPIALSWENVREYESGDLAAMHGDLLLEATMKDGATIVVNGRTTIVARRAAGVWRIVHEHDSVPAAMA